MHHNLILKNNEKLQFKIHQFISSSVHQFISRTPFKLAKVIVFSLFIFSACKNNDVVPEQIDNMAGSILFFGLKINLTDPIVTKVALKNYEVQEKAFLENKSSKLSAEFNKDLENISDKKLFGNCLAALPPKLIL